MKVRIVLVTLFVFCCLPATAAFAQEASGPGPVSPFASVWRINLYRIKPGKMGESMMDLRQNLRPILDEAKKQGVIVDYKVYTNITQEGVGDWDIAVAIAFKNWAALDGVGSKMDAITLKHFGTREKRQAADEHRRELGEEVSSRLMREIILRPPSTPETSQTTTPKQP